MSSHAEAYGYEPRFIHVDIETYSGTDISRGLPNYVADPEFEITLTSWSDGLKGMWADPAIHQYEGFPIGVFRKLLEDPTVIFTAFNAAFEDICFRRYGLAIPPERWCCTMTMSYQRGFSGRLADVGPQVGLPESLCKMDGGTRLITKWACPRKPTQKNPNTRLYPADDPESWEQFKTYNRQDVEAERQIFWRLPPETRLERETWVLDYWINRNGLPVDVKAAETGSKLAESFRQEMAKECKLICGHSPSQVKAITEWVGENWKPIAGLSAPVLEELLRDTEIPDDVKRVLEIRRDSAQAATKKLDSLLSTQYRGIIYLIFQLCGASRTGRWGGRGFQPHNLKRPTIKNPEVVSEILADGISFDAFKRLFDLSNIGDAVRSMIKAEDGLEFHVADFSSIESAVLGWVSRCQALMGVFEKGLDPYKEFATHWLRKEYEEVTKAERNLSKPPTLGCGFGLGPDGLVDYAESMGVELTDQQAKTAVHTYRSVYWEVPIFWKNVERAFIRAMNGNAAQVTYCSFQREPDYPEFVTIKLPSGRKLWYHLPEMDADGSITFMGQNQYTQKWERLRTYGARLVENIVQAIARDVLLWALFRVSNNNRFLIRGHVHDEIITTTVEGKPWMLEWLEKEMKRPIGWAPGLKLDAHGYTAKRYRKD